MKQTETLRECLTRQAGRDPGEPFTKLLVRLGGPVQIKMGKGSAIGAKDNSFKEPMPIMLAVAVGNTGAHAVLWMFGQN